MSDFYFLIQCSCCDCGLCLLGHELIRALAIHTRESTNVSHHSSLLVHHQHQHHHQHHHRTVAHAAQIPGMANIRNIPLNEACCTTLEGVHDQLWSNGLEVKWARHKEHEKKLGQADRWHLVNEEEIFEVHLSHVKINVEKRVNRLCIQGKKGWTASKLDQVKFVLTAQRFDSRPPNHDPEMMKVPLGDDECSMTTDNFNEVRRWHGPVSYTHLRAHETRGKGLCRLLR